MVDSTASLDWGCRVVLREGSWQWRWYRRFQGEGALSSFRSLAGKGALVAVVAMVAGGHVGVIDGAVVPKIGMPLRQDAVSVVAVNVWSQAPATPMAHSQAVEAEPLGCSVRTHHVVWTTPSDNNCRRAVDGT
jgi:hypothetical protein